MGASGLFRAALRRTGMRAVRLRPASSGTKASVKRAQIGRAAVSLSFFCLMLVLLCGFTGHCQQHADFIIRNAVYERLAANSWPLVTEDGHHFIYYLGHWLPPALAASFCPA